MSASVPQQRLSDGGGEQSPGSKPFSSSGGVDPQTPHVAHFGGTVAAAPTRGSRLYVQLYMQRGQVGTTSFTSR